MDEDSANPLLLQWLKEWMDEARERNSKGHTVYKKAYHSMRLCPTAFLHPSEAQQLNGLGPKLCDRLTDKLKNYNAEHGLPMPEKLYKTASKDKRAVPQPEDEAASVTTKKRKPTTYVPKLRSGAYALIIALATLDPDGNRALSKNELIELAQDHCDSSFTVGSDTTKHYTAWSSMKTLETKELVCTKGHPTKRYYLSDEGWETALACKKISGDGQSTIGKPKKASRELPTKSPAKKSASGPSQVEKVPELDASDIVDLSSEPDITDHVPLKTRVVSSVDSGGDTTALPSHYFEVKIVLDNREVRSKTDRDYISSELRKLGISPVIRALPLGDVLWVAKVKPEYLSAIANEYDTEEGSDEIVLDHIVERKRLDDLISSIKDGRFHEQKFRLRKSGLQNVTYLVEAFSISAERSETYGQSVETAITSTQVVNDIFVKQTTKLDETIKYLARLTRTLQELYSTRSVRVVRSNFIDTYLSKMQQLRKMYPDSTIGTTFSAFQALCDKNDATTLRDVYLKMLLCIRGVTADKAIEIQKIWPTPISLIEAYEACATAKDRDTLISDRLGLVNIIPRKKIGKALSTKIAEIWHGLP